MPHIALPDGVPGINAGLTYRPETAKPLLGLAQALLSDDNTLSRGDRELIAAYVSSLNECQFCQASHSAFAAVQLDGGLDLVEQVKRDPDTAPITDKLRALLKIAAAFCMYNRYVDGLGTWQPDDGAMYMERAPLIAEHGYARA